MYKEIMEEINYVKDTPNCYAILGGDLINNSTRASAGDVYTEDLSPMSQIKKACEMFYPIKDKILCITSGNHERRSYKSDGIDLMNFFACEMGIPNKYDFNSCVAFVKFGSAINRSKKEKQQSAGSKINYSIYVTHGDGTGGRTIGGKANGLERRGNIIDADVILTGHTHQSMTFQEMSYQCVNSTHTVVEKIQTFVNAASALDYEGYAELYGLKPSSRANPHIFLSGTKKEVTVRI